MGLATIRFSKKGDNTVRNFFGTFQHFTLLNCILYCRLFKNSTDVDNPKWESSHCQYYRYVKYPLAYLPVLYCIHCSYFFIIFLVGRPEANIHAFLSPTRSFFYLYIKTPFWKNKLRDFNFNSRVSFLIWFANTFIGVFKVPIPSCFWLPFCGLIDWKHRGGGGGGEETRGKRPFLAICQSWLSLMCTSQEYSMLSTVH